MKIHLGYVSLPLSISITSSATITYTNYQKLSKKEQKAKLDQLIRSNLGQLEDILFYNIRNNIHFYRLSSKLLPLVTHPLVSFSYYVPYKDLYNKIGKLINDHNMRVDLHPDQFAVLNSDRKEVVDNTINILKYHDKLLSLCKIKNGKLILHVGSNQGGKEEAIKRFKENFYKLPANIKNRVVLENDDKVFQVLDVLALCQELKIPMVLDYHHFLCNNNKEKIEDYLEEIFATWKDTNLPPKIHFSSPKNKTKKDFRSHSEYINGPDFMNFLKILKKVDCDVDIMLEAKGKDRALFDLVSQIKYLGNYHFIDETTLLI